MAAANVLSIDYFPTYLKLKTAVKLIVEIMDPQNNQPTTQNAFRQAYRLTATELVQAVNARNVYMERQLQVVPQDLDWIPVQKEMNATAIAESWASNSSSNHPTRAMRNRECTSWAAKVIRFAIRLMNNAANYVTFANRTMTEYMRKKLEAEQAQRNAARAAQEADILDLQLHETQAKLTQEQTGHAAVKQQVDQLQLCLQNARVRAQQSQDEANVKRAQLQQLHDELAKMRAENEQKMSESERIERDLRKNLKEEQEEKQRQKAAKEAYEKFLQKDDAAGYQYLMKREDNSRELNQKLRSLGLPPASLSLGSTASRLPSMSSSAVTQTLIHRQPLLGFDLNVPNEQDVPPLLHTTRNFNDNDEEDSDDMNT